MMRTVNEKRKCYYAPQAEIALIAPHAIVCASYATGNNEGIGYEDWKDLFNFNLL